jgi:hypothetical protein
MNIAPIRDWLVNLGKGAVQAFGEPTVMLELVDHPNGKGEVACVREGYTLHQLPGPERHRRTHRFDDLAGFADWLGRHADPTNTEILFATNGTVTAAIDPGNVHGDIVTCQLTAHPRLSRWLAVVQADSLTQRDLHRMITSSLEDFPPARDTEGNDLGSSGKFLAAQVGRVAVASSGEIKCEVDDLGYTRFSGGSAAKSVTGSLPPTFAIRVPWFLGARPEAVYDLDLHLAVEPGTGGVTFELEAPGLPVVRHAALLDAVAYLRELLGEDWLVGLGELKVVAVPTVRG